MDVATRQAEEQLELADAELAVLKQEQVLRELLRTREPTAEGTALLKELRENVERLSAGSKNRQSTDTREAERIERAA